MKTTIKLLLSLLTSSALILSFCGGCATKPVVNMGIVKEGLAVPGSYSELGYHPNLQLATERGLVLEPLDYTHYDYISSDDIPDGGFSQPVPFIIGVTEEKTIQVPDEYFFTLQAYYRKSFEVYLLTTLRLDLIEKEIEDSGLGFRQMDYKEMSLLERLSNLNLKHLYICVPMRIEQLSQQDADELKRLYAENGPEITEEA